MQEEIYGRDILISVNAKEVYGSYVKRSERIAVWQADFYVSQVGVVYEM